MFVPTTYDRAHTSDCDLVESNSDGIHKLPPEPIYSKKIGYTIFYVVYPTLLVKT